MSPIGDFIMGISTTQIVQDNKSEIESNLVAEGLNFVNQLSNQYTGSSVFDLILDDVFHYISKDQKDGYIGELRDINGFPRLTLTYKTFKNGEQSFPFRDTVIDDFVELYRSDLKQTHKSQYKKYPDLKQALLEYKTLPKTGTSDYLVQKKVHAQSGMRFTSINSCNCISLPLHNSDLEIVGIQFIADKNIFHGKKDNKHFPKGTPKRGSFYPIGIDYKQAKTIAVVGGFATALSVYETGEYDCVINTIDDGNIFHIVQMLKSSVPSDTKIIIAADNDHLKKQNSGITKAKKVSQQFQVQWTHPVFNDDDKGTDFNDVHVTQGMDAVIKQLRDNLTEPDSKLTTPQAPKEPKTEFLQRNDKGNPSLPKHLKATDYLIEHKYLDNLRFNAMDETWYQYNGSFWERAKNAGFKLINSVLRKLTQEVGTCNRNYTEALEKNAKTELTSNDWNLKQNIIPFKNGIFNTQTGQVDQYNRDDFLTWQLPYDFNQNATCPTFLSWLDETTEGDIGKQKALQAYLNACLTSRPELEKYLELVGKAGSGKGTFIKVAENLVGQKNTHSSRLAILASNNVFEPSNFFEKRLITFPDEGDFRGNTGLFESLTGNDSLRFERKGMNDSHSFKFKGMVIVASHNAIASNDAFSGIRRRRISISFDHIPKKPDPFLSAKIEREMSGIANWCMKLSRDEVTDILMNYKPSNSIAELYKTNSMAAWLIDNTQNLQGSRTYIGNKKYLSKTSSIGDRQTDTVRLLQNVDTHLYPNYVDYCESNGEKTSTILSINKFKDALLNAASDLGWDLTPIRDKHGRCLEGISIKNINDSNIDLSIDNANLVSGVGSGADLVSALVSGEVTDLKGGADYADLTPVQTHKKEEREIFSSNTGKFKNKVEGCDYPASLAPPFKNEGVADTRADTKSAPEPTPVEIDEKFYKVVVVQQKILNLLNIKPSKYDLLFDKINETISINEDKFSMAISKLQDDDKLDVVGDEVSLIF